MSCHLFLFIYFPSWHSSEQQMHILMHTKPMLPPFNNGNCQVVEAAAIAPIVREKTISQFKWATYYERFVSNELASKFFFSIFIVVAAVAVVGRAKNTLSAPFFRLHFVVNSFIIYIYIVVVCCEWHEWAEDGRECARSFVRSLSLVAHYQLSGHQRGFNEKTLETRAEV